ncbi:HK97 gp10 family phage protein [Herminiimonas contaminans]|uniref:HK97 gp10 family phage protein n=1 Tax=Herminiimonas contaminans TaxID=1111140 RepID=A0ABS0EXW7_9BURK|nr:HK97 gp10 family phage protein [Herminiimonas contaminans]MBF8179655.1 HK97 gp10 family phage protein [Herminiimonas contaminans]
MSTSIVITSTQLQAKGRRAVVSFARTLDRFVQRGAQEFGREEKKQAPKAFTILTNSVAVKKNGIADYTVRPGSKYAAWVNNGTAPHQAPLQPLMQWLRLTKRVSDGKELYARARGLQRFIAAHGTKANPFVDRTREAMHGRVMVLLHDGVHTGIREAFPA